VDALLAELAVVERHAPMPPALAGLVGSGPLGRAALGVAALVLVLAGTIGGLALLGLFV